MQKNNAAYSIRLILIVIGISGILLTNFNRSYSGNLHAISIIFLIVQLIIMEIMLRESDIYSTNYFRIINLGIAIYIVGALFKILHFDGADLLLLTSLSSVGLTYFIRTANKKNINLLDISKCVWIMIACANTIFNLLHWMYADILAWINLFSFGAMAILFFISTPKKRSPQFTKQKYFDIEDKPIDQV